MTKKPEMLASVRIYEQDPDKILVRVDSNSGKCFDTILDKFDNSGLTQLLVTFALGVTMDLPWLKTLVDAVEKLTINRRK